MNRSAPFMNTHCVTHPDRPTFTQRTMQIYIAKPGSSKEGPFSLDQINRDLAARKYTDNDYWAWHEGLPQWVPLYEIPGVSSKAAPFSAPKPAPASPSPQPASISSLKPAPQPPVAPEPTKAAEPLQATEPAKPAELVKPAQPVKVTLPVKTAPAQPAPQPKPVAAESARPAAALPQTEPATSPAPATTEPAVKPAPPQSARSGPVKVTLPVTATASLESAKPAPEPKPAVVEPVRPAETPPPVELKAAPPAAPPIESSKPQLSPEVEVRARKTVETSQPVAVGSATVAADAPSQPTASAPAPAPEHPVAAAPPAAVSPSAEPLPEKTARPETEPPSPLPLSALEQIFVFTTGEGRTFFQSQTVARKFHELTGQSLETIRENVHVDIIGHASVGVEVMEGRPIPRKAWRAMFSIRPVIAQGAKDDAYQVRTHAFTTENSDTVAALLFYKKQKL